MAESCTSEKAAEAHSEIDRHHIMQGIKHALESLPKQIKEDAEKFSKDLVDLVEAIIPEKMENQIESIDAAIDDMYEETQDAVTHPGQLAAEVKRETIESAHDIEKVMASIKEGSLTLQTEVDETMKSFIEDSVKCVHVTSRKELQETEANTLKGILLKWC